MTARRPSTANLFRELEMKAGDVHLWYVHFETAPLLEQSSIYEMVLREDEIESARRCVALRQRELLATRGSLRILLSRYFPAVEPRAWTFTMNEFGKPAVSGPIEIAPFKFNVSHSQGMAVIGFSLCEDFGIDVERVDRERSAIELAESHFSSAEFEELKSRQGHQATERFFEYWTLKEAFIKALGMGLSLPLDQFSFTIGGPNPAVIQIKIEDSIGWAAGNWKFLLVKPKPMYQLAIAVKDRGPFQFRCVEKGEIDSWFTRRPRAA